MKNIKISSTQKSNNTDKIKKKKQEAEKKKKKQRKQAKNKAAKPRRHKQNQAHSIFVCELCYSDLDAANVLASQVCFQWGNTGPFMGKFGI